MKFSNEQKKELVALYYNGESAADICLQNGVPRSTFKERGNPQQLTFHSDRGAQYTSNALRKLLCVNKVVQSFSKSGSPYDNAVAEAFFASMKREELYRTIYKSERQFCESVDNYIRFYNSKRPHSTLNYKTPDKFELLYEEKKKHAI